MSFHRQMSVSHSCNGLFFQEPDFMAETVVCSKTTKLEVLK